MVGHYYEGSSNYNHSRKGACSETIQDALGREGKKQPAPLLVGREVRPSCTHSLTLPRPLVQSPLAATLPSQIACRCGRSPVDVAPSLWTSQPTTACRGRQPRIHSKARTNLQLLLLLSTSWLTAAAVHRKRRGWETRRFQANHCASRSLRTCSRQGLNFLPAFCFFSPGCSADQMAVTPGGSSSFPSPEC